jgi:hypothetical protein
VTKKIKYEKWQQLMPEKQTAWLLIMGVSKNPNARPSLRLETLSLEILLCGIWASENLSVLALSTRLVFSSLNCRKICGNYEHYRFLQDTQ